MAFDRLTEKLTESFKRITKQDRISEKHLDTLLSDVRLALLDADVNTQVVNQFLDKIHASALNQKILTSLKPNEALMKLVYDELVELLGPETPSFDYPKGQKKIILFVGLQGTGKTTSIAKIANILKNKKNKNVLLVAADIVRPAAIEQLKTLGKSIDVEVFSLGAEVSAVETSKQALQYAKDNNYDTILIDTAGRLHIDEALMNELKNINETVKADEILLSVDAMTGQDIVNVARTFHEQLPISGLVVTKFDGDSRGGGILSVKSITNVPIKFVGQGEKVEDMDIFYPERMADRILGMGDIVSLVEHAQEKMDMEEAEKSAQRMMEGTFTMNDMLFQLEQTTKLGSISGLMKMIPGMSGLAGSIDDDAANNQIKKTRAIIHSMTKKERKDPSIMRSSHKRRIALGSGTSINDVNKLINQFNKMKQMFKQLGSIQKNGGFNQNTLDKLMNQTKGMNIPNKGKWKF